MTLEERVARAEVLIARLEARHARSERRWLLLIANVASATASAASVAAKHFFGGH